MSAEDAATYDRMVDDVDRMKKEIDRLERQDAIENEMNKPVGQPIVNRPDNGQPKEKAKRGTASAEYNSAFWNMVRAKAMSYEIHNALKIGEDDHGGYLARIRAHPGGGAGGSEHLPSVRPRHHHFQRRPQDPRCGFQGYCKLDR